MAGGLGCLMAGPFLLGYINETVIVPLLSSLTREELEEARKEQEESDRHPTFIPLPGTLCLIQPPPYKGTDPEWQNYRKFSTDRQLMANIYETLAERTRNSVQKSAWINEKYGPVEDLKIQRVFPSDPDFPLYPPREFEIKGICFDEDGICITSKPVDSLAAQRMQRFWWPSTAAAAAGSFCYALTAQTVKSVAKNLGWKSNDEEDSVEKIEQKLQQIRQQMEKPIHKPLSDVESQGQQEPDAKSQGSSTSTTKTTGSATQSASLPSAESTGRSGEPVSRKKKDVEFMIPGSNVFADHIKGPLRAMKTKFNREWRPVEPDPPRGAIRIKILVKCGNKNFNIVVESISWYDPMTENLNTRSMKVRSEKPTQIRPLR